MAKRKHKNDEEQNKKKRKEGRGQGSFENYKPWLRIQDVSSKGLSTRIKGWKTNRVHQFLSYLELSYFYLFEWSKTVIDIREQFPLNLSETEAIARELRIKHPTHPSTRKSVVMTSDFVITINKGIRNFDKVLTVKYAKELNNKRVLEKFNIEQIYWRNRNINWTVVTEKDINTTFIENIKWLHSYRDKESLPPEINDLHLQKSLFLITQILNEGSYFLYQITQFCDSKLNLPQGQSINIFRHLAANHQFDLDMTQPLNLRKKVYLMNQLSEGGIL